MFVDTFTVSRSEHLQRIDASSYILDSFSKGHVCLREKMTSAGTLGRDGTLQSFQRGDRIATQLGAVVSPAGAALPVNPVPPVVTGVFLSFFAPEEPDQG